MYTIMVVFVKIRLQLNCLNKKVEKMNVNPIEYSNLFHSFQQAWLVFQWVVLVVGLSENMQMDDGTCLSLH